MVAVRGEVCVDRGLGMFGLMESGVRGEISAAVGVRTPVLYVLAGLGSPAGPPRTAFVGSPREDTAAAAWACDGENRDWCWGKDDMKWGNCCC